MFTRAFIDSLLGHSPFDSWPRPWRRAAVLALIALLLVVVATLAFKLGGWAAQNPLDATDPNWTQVMASKVARARQWWIAQLSALTLLEAYLTMAILYRTPLGKVLWWWNPNKDIGETAGAKTLGASLTFCALLLGFAILNGQVLP